MKRGLITRRSFLAAAPAIVLARKAEAWYKRASPIVQPPPAQLFSYNNLVFNDEFDSLSGFDLTNSGAAGFKWYLNNRWPDAVFTDPAWDPWHTVDPTNPSVLSVANSILTISADASGFGEVINTACFSGSGPGYVGNVFANGLYAECRCQYDGSNYTGSNGWPAFWNMPVNWMVGAADHMVEFDIMEALFGGQQSVYHIWNHTTNPAGNTIVGGSTITAGTSYHTYGWLWVPASKNAGIGIVRCYIDGVLAPGSGFNSTYSLGDPLSIMETHSYPFILGSGITSFPLNVDWVRVWQ